MNQQKIGLFLKELRTQKGATQEQIAEVFHVSSRTVSRWENGKNMPDFDVLIELSDYYQVDLRDLLNGERNAEKMEKAMEETVIKAVDYTNAETERHLKRSQLLLTAAVILFAVAQIINHTPLGENEMMRAASDFALGLGCGSMIIGVVATNRFGAKLCAVKNRLLHRN